MFTTTSTWSESIFPVLFHRKQEPPAFINALIYLTVHVIIYEYRVSACSGATSTNSYATL